MRFLKLFGDIVRIKERPERVGYVSGIKDYGTHVIYFVDLGDPIKFPEKLEWLELIEKGGIK